MDLTILTDEELNQYRIDVATEQERRARLAQAPTQIADMARRYVEDGGDIAVVQAAVEPVAVSDAPEPEADPEA